MESKITKVDKQIIYKIFNDYFNVNMNKFLYGVSSYENLIIDIYKRGSMYQIRITPPAYFDHSLKKQIEIQSNILNYIYINSNNFITVLLDMINGINKKYTNSRILLDTIVTDIQPQTLIVNFFVCYGFGCPEKFESVSLRAGIVPYFILNGIEYVILGTKIYVEGTVYSDFGGGCKTSKRELSYNCANRELVEESLGIITQGGIITHIYHNEYTAWKGYKVEQTIYFIDYTKNLGITGKEEVDKYILLDINQKYKELLKSKRVKDPELEDIIIIKYETFKILPDELLGENLRGLKELFPQTLLD